VQHLSERLRQQDEQLQLPTATSALSSSKLLPLESINAEAQHPAQAACEMTLERMEQRLLQAQHVAAVAVQQSGGSTWLACLFANAYNVPTGELVKR
jgi:hypothetical protein